MHVRLPHLLALALSISIASELALIGRHIVVPSKTMAAQIPTLTSDSLSENLHREVLSILQASLFGTQTVESSQQVTPSQAGLTIHGIIATADPEKGFAIIGASTGTIRVVAIGESIEGGAILKAVFGDHVILERGGGTESLLLHRAGIDAFLAPMPEVVAAASKLGVSSRTMDRLLSQVANMQHSGVDSIPPDDPADTGR
jgi:type II secretory pathway component PulC